MLHTVCQVAFTFHRITCSVLYMTYGMLTQPHIGPMVEGDLCDIRVGRTYCHQDAVTEAVDANGATRILCAEHLAKYFPTTAITIQKAA